MIPFSAEEARAVITMMQCRSRVSPLCRETPFVAGSNLMSDDRIPCVLLCCVVEGGLTQLLIDIGARLWYVYLAAQASKPNQQPMSQMRCGTSVYSCLVAFLLPSPISLAPGPSPLPSRQPHTTMTQSIPLPRGQQRT
ncbi:hypothetical protein HaLaN_17127 [Haematococcus lacustris]|uniref:Uncharacterized protein n=1 Tax=Haematococcus lacustris TaxID=44745 RepID=A0A699ZM99_HAELA|nr:hypothetical protein HaLaN_17127 [Haematococcus lacustris]